MNFWAHECMLSFQVVLLSTDISMAATFYVRPPANFVIPDQSPSMPLATPHLMSHATDQNMSNTRRSSNSTRLVGSFFSSLPISLPPSLLSTPTVLNHYVVIMYYMRFPTYKWLANRSITPSNTTTYSLTDMQAALTAAHGTYKSPFAPSPAPTNRKTGATPYIGCSGPRYNETAAGKGSSDSGRTVVDEMWYYMWVNGRPQDGKAVPVNATAPNTSCAKASGALNYYLRTPSSLQ